MVSTYNLTTDPLGEAKLNKVAKDALSKLVKESVEDRQLAIEAYKYFKKLLEESDFQEEVEGENPRIRVERAAFTSELFKGMLDALKLAQTSKQSNLKLVELIAKLRKPTGRGKKTGGEEEGGSVKDPEDLFKDMD